MASRRATVIGSGALSRRHDQSTQALLDRIEDRLIDAPEGLHRTGPPASAEALAKAELDPEIGALWARWDGLEFGNGEACLLSLEAQVEATAVAAEAGVLAPGDRVVGELGPALLVIPADPWEAGAEIVMVEEGERAPYASSVVRLALGLVAEMSLLYDDDGEYREGLFEEFGTLTARAERKLSRRRLDFDPDAPFPRFRLAQILRRAGELRAAKKELERVLHCAPEFEWAYWELGRTQLDIAERDQPGSRGEATSLAGAAESFEAAAQRVRDAPLRALFKAWQARATVDDEARTALAMIVRELDPGFAAAREAGLREAIEDQDQQRASELLALGLTIEPRHLGLLAQRRAVEEMPRPTAATPDPEPRPASTESRSARGGNRGTPDDRSADRLGPTAGKSSRSMGKSSRSTTKGRKPRPKSHNKR